MGRSCTNDLKELTQRVEADHREMAKACEQVWLEELERRRKQLATECSRLLLRR